MRNSTIFRKSSFLLSIISLVICSSLFDKKTSAAETSVVFHFDANAANVSCNDQILKISGSSCAYKDGKIIISSDKWPENHTADISAETTAVSGGCAASIIGGAHGQGKCGGTINSCNIAQSSCEPIEPTNPSDPNQSRWPETTGDPIIHEWYSDIPWHQKLGTYAGNTIDQPFVLPYKALPAAIQSTCQMEHLDDPECMIKYGIVNILGIERTDTLYKKSNTLNCDDCVQVKLSLYKFNTQGENGAKQANIMGSEHPGQDLKNYGGYVITDGTTYAPQLPFYMAHYCDKDFPANKDLRDPVCYADYFTTMISGFGSGIQNGMWMPWSVFPATEAPGPGNHCQQGTDDGLDKCTMILSAFDLKPVSEKVSLMTYPDNKKVQTDFPFHEYNKKLIDWFNLALAEFEDDGVHFPWNHSWKISKNGLDEFSVFSPFIGNYDAFYKDDILIDNNTTETYWPNLFKHPNRCNINDLKKVSESKTSENERLHLVNKLRACGVNFEFHHNGFLHEWPESLQDQVKEMSKQNQYGRTSFMFAGVPGEQTPLSYKSMPGDGITLHEKVYNSSIFTLYMPVTNIADQTHAMRGRNYIGEFYETTMMSNHQDQDPDTFIDGLRGKVLWHNEYRSKMMFTGNAFMPKYTFQASFDIAKSPFHSHTCDACHVRNGSGIPLKPDYTIEQSLLEKGVTKDYKIEPSYTFSDTKTFSEKIIRPMKLVLIDLSKPDHSDEWDQNNYYNPIMNFYGDSFHVNQNKPDEDKQDLPTYDWKYDDTPADSLVVKAIRKNSKTGKVYRPQRAILTGFKTLYEGSGSTCQFTRPKLTPPERNIWPKDCTDINGEAIKNSLSNGTIGFMHLNGKRLGNLGPIEALPETFIRDIQKQQQSDFKGNKFAGSFQLSPGARGGKVSTLRRCENENDCYIARFGWIGDRVSLEDQVANAARTEMNILTPEGFVDLYGRGAKIKNPLRYNTPVCGPADKKCQQSPGNSSP